MFHKSVVSKRGDLVLEYIVPLIMAFFVGFIMLNSASAFASGERSEKIRHAQELALLLESASSSQDTFSIKYPFDLQKYHVKVTPKEVIVYKDSPEETTAAKVELALSPDQYVNALFNNPKSLYIAKAGNKVVIAEEEPLLNQFECPDVVTANPQWLNGKIFMNSNSPDLFALLQEPSSNIDFGNIVTNSFQEQDAYLYVMQVKILVNQDPSETSVKIYYLVKDPKQSQKMGCLLLNEFAKLNITQNIALIPVTVDSLRDNDYKKSFFSFQDYIKTKAPLIILEMNVLPDAPANIKKGFEKALVRYYS